MDRRHFLKATGVLGASRWLAGSALSLALVGGTAAAAGADEDSLAVLTKAADGQVAKTIADKATSLTGSPRGLTRQIRRLLTPFVWARSEHYHDEALLPVVEEMLTTLEGRQHADGTYSVGNRHSPPDTGFLIEDMGLMVSILGADDHAASAGFSERIAAIMAKAGPGLAAGGVHTPNHRWKICAALARIAHVTGDMSYVSAIDAWFAEGLDVDEDGIYSERSPIYYSEVTNPSLLVVAHVLERPELVDVVRQNLNTSIEHAEPGGDIETIQSRRQDQDHRQITLRYFYTQFRELALLDNDGRFAAVAKRIETLFSKDMGDFLGDLIERPELAANLPAEEEPFTDFSRHYKTAGLVRLRRGKLSASAFGGSDWYHDGVESPFYNRIGSGLSTNPTMLRAWNGKALLDSVRMVPNFFSMGHFRSNGIAYEDGTIRLGNELKVPYYLPMRPEDRNEQGVYALSRSVDGRFYSMLDFENRPVATRDLKTAVEISEVDSGFDLNLDVTGESDVEITLELAFREGGEISGAEALEDGTYHLLDGHGSYTVGEDSVRFGPGNGPGLIEARPGEQYSWAGGDLVLKGPRVFITGKSPLTYTLELRFA